MRDKAINYLEFPSHDPMLTKAFFDKIFKWTFTDYGEDYTAFETPEMSGGFYRSNKSSSTAQGGCLIVFYVKQLEALVDEVERAGGRIEQPIFDFPGGRRFHFTEPGGSEFAAWSE